MSQSSLSRDINVRIRGDISGQVAIGENILQIGEIHGGVVNIIPPARKPVFSRRSSPVYLRPRPFQGLLDRQDEQKLAVSTLQASEPLSLSGRNGSGKTSLLRHLAYNAPGDTFPDGIVYISAREYTVDDLQQFIFDVFFESDIPAKPTNAELSRSLQELRALILMDDISLEFSDAVRLINSAPHCALVFASTERFLWGEGCSIELEGLPIPDAILLLERELNHPIQAHERPAIESFCRAVNGHPLYILQGAAMLGQGMSISDVTGKFRQPEASLVGSVFAMLSDAQRQVLAALAVAGENPVPIQHLTALCQGVNLKDALKKLLALRLVQANSPAYNLTGTLAPTIEQTVDLSQWKEYFLQYFVGWIRKNQPLPDVTDALNLLLALLERSNHEQRWDEVITIGRGIEKALIFDNRWSAWARTLEMILNAAQALGNQVVQAWALHQIGTRDLCLNDLEAARDSLTQALKIREALGDKTGAAITRHNLDLIVVPPAPPKQAPRSGPAGGVSAPLKIFFTFLVIAGITGLAVVLLLLSYFGFPPLALPEAIPVATTRAPTQPVINTKTPTPRPTRVTRPSPTINPCRPGVWYCEDFNDGEAQFWELDAGWQVQDGMLSGSRHTFAILTDHEWEDHLVTYLLRVERGTIHLSYRLTRVSNGYNRYFIGVEQNGVYLSKQVGDSFWDTIRYTQTYIPPGEWMRVEIAGWGAHLRIYLNGELVIEYVDRDYIRSGTIAFETLDRSIVQIDDIEVMSAGLEPPLACVTLDEKTDRPGLDYNEFIVKTAEECRGMCWNDSQCQAFAYVEGECRLKNGQPASEFNEYYTSGIKVCP
jgi:hypothetical protein